MTDKTDVAIDPCRMQVDLAPPLDYDLAGDLDIPLEPWEITPDGWPECAITDDEPLPFASRPMFGFIEGGLIAATALIGIGLLVWGIAQ